MCNYFANAPSLFLDLSLRFEDVPKDHFVALRNLDSFRLFAKKLLEEGATKRLRHLLDSDPSLFAFTQNAILQGRKVLADAITATEVVRAAQKALPSTSVTAKSKLYIQAFSNKLLGSPLIRSLLLSIRKAPSNITLEVLKSMAATEIHEDVKAQAAEIESELEDLIEAQGNSKQPLRSEDDVKNSTMRTTVVAQKVELSKQKSALSKQDTAYTAIVRRLSDLLESYLSERLESPKALVMPEIFMYDLRSPYREVFTPRPRHAIERALAAPHDYLDCDCCAPGQEGEEATLAGSQPATAVLYQLYLESGSLINASDLWQAFQAVIGDSQEDEQQTMALFQRSLAELRYMGMVKGTRKRVDHVAKIAWKGL
jgi:origin recognition complex subunit 3